MTAIELTGVSRWYGELVALRDVTCEIGAGVTVVAGPNGAGKSTLLALIAGAVRPSRGSVRVLGRNPGRSAAVFRDLAYVPQGGGLPDDLTARRLLTFAVRATVGRRTARDAVEELLDRFDLAPVADRPVSACSNGNRQRIRVAMACAGSPRVLILDEPFVGLDRAHRADLTAQLEAVADGGAAVVLSSHVDAGIERRAALVLTLDRGRLCSATGGRSVRIDALGAPELAARLVRAGLAARVEQVEPGAVRFEATDLEELSSRIVRIAALSGTRIDRLVVGAAAEEPV